MALVRSSFKEGLPMLKLRDSGVTAIAINRGRSSQMALKWATDNLLNADSKCILIHVQSKTVHLEDYFVEPEEGCSQTSDEVEQLFLPYRAGCARKGIKPKEVVIQDADVPSALVDFVVNNSIASIVVGASSRNILARRFRNTDVASCLLKSAPESCTVYVISKGSLQNSRPSSRPQTPTNPVYTPRIPQTPNGSVHTPRTPQTPASGAPTPRQQHYPRFPYLPPDNSVSEDVSRGSSSRKSSKSELSGRVSSESHFFRQFDDKARPWYKTFSFVTSTNNQSSDVFNRDSISDQSDLSGPISLPSTDHSETKEFSIESPSSNSSNSPKTSHELEAEIRRLKLELKHSLELYNTVCKEAVLAKQMAKGLQQLHQLEARKLEARLAEEAAWSLAEMEKKKSKAVMEAAHMAQCLAEMENQKRNDSEMRAKNETEQMRKEMTLTKNDARYRRYTIDEIEAATNYFHISNKIGEGGYGPVFKGVLDHIPVAIKVLRPDFSQGQKQFQQEVGVLSSMRHPHMVLLLGACPEYGCLVYEYMDYGSLEDRLFRKDGTPPIPWKTRFKIAAEIATALLFLHETKPEPVVHRDLKPANILLNCNYVSKIGDVGLARLVPQSAANNGSQYRMTAAAGTFCYIDPEYQQTGKLTVKSDLYSLGILLLQLVTAKPPIGLTFQVEQSIKKGTFLDILDPTLTGCPVEETLSLAKLALKCCELRKNDRPSLASEVLPELNRLKDLKLAGEAGEPELILPQLYQYKSDQQVQSHTSQEGMTNNPDVELENSARNGWRHRMKYMTKLWSFKSEKVRPLPPRGNQPFGRTSNTSEFAGCWSFVSCSSVANAPMQRHKSFS